ncbi:CopG family antitoxin [Elusimicrobiota bacterium]
MKKSKKKIRKSEKSLRNYYDSHSTLGSGKEVKEAHIAFPKPRRLVTLRLEEESLDALRRIAARKGLNYSTLMRMWITERLHQE